MIKAEVICDSISPQGKRLTTFKLRYPKFIHGEFMTHRVISRNASSSRAIPTAKLLEEVRSSELRAEPVFWGKNQSGMQAAEELADYPTNKEVKNGAPYTSPKMEVQIAWSRAAMNAAHEAEQMLKFGAHKQIVNRLLEPFSHINVIASATEWDNFFGLRLHKDAQPEMRRLAEHMWVEYTASGKGPNHLPPGEWHLPFIDGQADVEIAEHIYDPTEMNAENDKNFLACCIKVSVARCARVSYESFETGKRSTIEEDLKLYDRLLGAQPLHASPAEHQATPDTYHPEKEWDQASPWDNPKEHGNFVGWRQFRKMISGESCAPMPEGY